MKINVLIKVFFCLFICLFAQTANGESYHVLSPDGKLRISLHINNGVQYEIRRETTQLLSPSVIGLNPEDGQVIGQGTVGSVETNQVNNVLPVFIGKNKTLDETYNETTIHFNEGYDLIVRAYNIGVAYRWALNLNRDVIIRDEDFTLNFANNPVVYFPEAVDLKNWEKIYLKYTTVNNIPANSFCISPILYVYPNTTYKLAVTEANTKDWPGLYLKPNGNNSMRGMFARYPETVEDPDNVYSQHDPITRFNYIARKPAGKHDLPWRVFVVSEDDKELLNNDLVYMLADPPALDDTSWIVPGKTAWEWWHKGMLTPDGKADPANGIPANGQENNNANWNYNLYKYYVDFAAENNFRYMTLDAGGNLGGDLRRLCTYAKQKGIGIIVWCWASIALESNHLEGLKASGVSGVKIDFFNRSDQIAMNWGWTLAQKLADLKMVGLFHGCPVPTGMNRAYPNILNYEAVRGAEDNFWRSTCTPEYHVQFPFVRFLAGPADYTPGSLRNVTERQFSPVDQYNIVPSSMGTRAHEMAMYVIFDQYLGFVSDAPTEYRKFPEILEFLSTVPTVWDKTVPLKAEFGQYILTAKQTGDDWYVGAMTNWTARDIEVDFSFLTPGRFYEAYIIKDGANANTYPARTAIEEPTVTSETKLTISMARGGGFAIRLKDVTEESAIRPVEEESLSLYVDRQAQLLYVYAGRPVQSLSVYNGLGQLVLKKMAISGEPLALSGLNKGSYAVKIETERGVITAKFVY
jgi:alpha-glucosidase